jgi:hypothetical protein
MRFLHLCARWFLHDLRQHNIHKLRNNLAMLDLIKIHQSHDVTEMYQLLLGAVTKPIDNCTPKKKAILGSLNPEYFTPLIKSLLVKRNRLMRRGFLSKANELASKLQVLIRNACSHCMTKLANADSDLLMV